MKSLYQTQPKRKTQNNKPEKQTKLSSLPSNLQTFQQKLLSVNGLMRYKRVQQFFNQ